MLNSFSRSFRLELIFVLLWNSGFIAAEYGLPYSGPFTLLFWRYLALCALLGLWLAFTGSLRWPGGTLAFRMFVVGVLAHGVWLSCVLIALNMNVPAGIVALITALQPLMTGALSGSICGERTDPRQWLGLVLGFCGVAIAVQARLAQNAETSYLGYMLPFVSALSMTIASLLQRRWTRHYTKRELGLATSLFYQSLFTTVALFAPAWAFEGLSTQWSAPFMGTMAWLVVAVSLGAYWSMWRLLAQKEASLVASLFYLSPPVTMLMAWLAFGDGVVATDFVGLAVAGAGVALVYRGHARVPSTV